MEPLVFFLGARTIQAIGASGIMPIANAVIGNSFSQEKLGTSLGLVGMIYGVGNILGVTYCNITCTFFWNRGPN